LADNHTPKGRVLCPDGGSGSHPERWTRGASTRSHMYSVRELHRERLRHAGAHEPGGGPGATRGEDARGAIAAGNSTEGKTSQDLFG
jgi:hypothetical protein